MFSDFAVMGIDVEPGTMPLRIRVRVWYSECIIGVGYSSSDGDGDGEMVETVETGIGIDTRIDVGQNGCGRSPDT